MRHKVAVYIPTYRQLTVWHSRSLEAAMTNSQTCQFMVVPSHGDTLIARVRNWHLHHFLTQSKADFYVQISDDIEILNRTAGNNAFDRLVAHDLPFVGAIYAPSADSPNKPHTSRLLPGVQADYNCGLIEVRWLSGGLWMLRRDTVQAMRDKYWDETHIESVMGDGMMAGLCCEFRHIEDDKVVWLSEDYALCERWHQMGGKIFADTAIALLHWGYHGFSIPGWPRSARQLAPLNSAGVEGEEAKP